MRLPSVDRIAPMQHAEDADIGPQRVGAEPDGWTPLA